MCELCPTPTPPTLLEYNPDDLPAGLKVLDYKIVTRRISSEVIVRQDPTQQIMYFNARNPDGVLQVVPVFAWFPYTYYRLETGNNWSVLVGIGHSVTPRDDPDGLISDAALPNQYGWKPCYDSMAAWGDNFVANIAESITKYWSGRFNNDGYINHNPAYVAVRDRLPESNDPLIQANPRRHARYDVFKEWEKLLLEEVMELPWRENLRMFQDSPDVGECDCCPSATHRRP